MKRSREALRKIIQEKGRDGFILDEMKRFGFWPQDAEVPTVQETLIKRERELRGELDVLLKEQRAQKNLKVQLRQMRKERMRAAKERRRETKERRETERVARANAWREKQEKDITYLGENVSHGLHKIESDPELLRKNGLVDYPDISTLAKQMDITVGKLRWLTFDRSVSETSHYRQFELPKKSGGVRKISAPMPLLKEAQRWVLENVLYRVSVTDAAHGFVPERGILTNALPHVGQTLVINLDLKNFFPTITYRRVKGMFQKLGYSEKIATIFGLLCTEPETDHLTADGKTYYVQTGARHLPQGAPSSPMLTNILCRRLDARLRGVADKFGMWYTRYADDLTFSGDDAKNGADVGKLLWQVRQIIKDEGFVEHPDKTQIMRKGARREVTGIVVNEKPNIARKKLRQFRAVVHQIEQNGPAGKTWGTGENVLANLQGYAAHVAMVRPDLGKEYLRRIEVLRKKYDAEYQKTAERTKTMDRPWWRRLLGI